MSWSVFVIECVIMCLVFGVAAIGSLLINPLTFISDYPPEIQERYYTTQHKEATKEKLTKIMKIKKVVALIFFALIFAWLTHLVGASTFWQALIVAYGLVLVLAAFDTFIIDWLLFSNIKRVRLPGTEDMDKEYHQKWFHVKVMLPMVPVFAVGGVVIALLTVLIW